MKRFSERFKQSLGIGSSNHWQATSNARNEAMEKQVRQFAQQLKQLHKSIVDLDASIQSGLATFKSVLVSNLPKAFNGHGSDCMAVDPNDHILGVNVDTEAFSGASTEMHSRLRQDVLVPLEQWLAEYRATKESNRKCEEMRLDLDNKRRQVAALAEKHQKLVAQNHRETEAAYTKLQTEEDKLTRLHQRFYEKEAEVFNAFVRLIRDSQVLRDYAAFALAIIQNCFTSVYTAFDMNAPTPMQVLPPPAPMPQSSMGPAIEVSASLRHSIGSMNNSGSQGEMMRSATTSRPATTSSNGGLPLALPGPSGYGKVPPSPNGSIQQVPSSNGGAYTAEYAPGPKYSSDGYGGRERAGGDDNPFADPGAAAPIYQTAPPPRYSNPGENDNPFTTR